MTKPKPAPTAPKRRGRHSKYTPELQTEIAKYIREGSTQDDAARLAGIGIVTFYEWIKRNPEFSEAIEKAHADFKRANVAAIRAAGVRSNEGKLDGSWQANAWLLERKYPAEFGLRITVKVSPEQIELLKKFGLTPSEAWEQLMQELAANAEASKK